MEPMTADELARRGRELYEQQIRTHVEPDHDGRFLAVDIDSGQYAVADDELGAFERAREQAPDGRLVLLRIGRRAAHRVGRQRLP